MSENTLNIHSHGRMVAIPVHEISFTFVRSGGPGGQNVNKVSSKAVMRWGVGASDAITDDIRLRLRTLYPSQMTAKEDPLQDEIVLTSQLTRDAPKNRDDCLEKLCRMVEEAMRRPRVRRPTRPGRGAIQRRLDDKRHQSDRKRGRRSPEI